MTEEEINKLKEERKKSAESGHIKWIIDNCLRTREGTDDYVFISYKSDDWERVLDDIVYKTCKKYGLRVYFDVDFDAHPELWIDQFQDNMNNEKCKAIIAFVDDAYCSSYATLMEMMASRLPKAGKKLERDKLPCIQINLQNLTGSNKGFVNTGLGTYRFSNGDINENAAVELKEFNRIFNKMLGIKRITESAEAAGASLDDLYEIKTELYKEKTDTLPEEGKILLEKEFCKRIMMAVKPSGQINDGTQKTFEDAIYTQLNSSGCSSVFGPIPQNDSYGSSAKPVQSVPAAAQPAVSPIQPVPASDRHEFHPAAANNNVPTAPRPPYSSPENKISKTEDHISGMIGLSDFVDHWSSSGNGGRSKFTTNSARYMRIIGTDEFAYLTTGFYESFRPAVLDFTCKCLDKYGQYYINTVNSYVGGKNLPFLPVGETAGKAVSYAALDSKNPAGYGLNVNYSAYDLISKVLLKNIKAVRMPTEKFYLEFTDVIPQNSTVLPSAAEKPPFFDAKPVSPEFTGAPHDSVVTNQPKSSDNSASSGLNHSGNIIYSGRISLPDFFKSWDDLGKSGKNKFMSDSFKFIRLVGTDGYEEYTTDYYDKSGRMVQGFVEYCLDKMGSSYINIVNGASKGRTVPFLTVDEANQSSLQYIYLKSESSKGYKLFANVSPYGWLKTVLEKHLLALGFNEEKFYFEFK